MYNYGFIDYCTMLVDDARMDAYAGAIRAAVAPDSVVLDLGAGTGIHSILAVRAGARRVYAVEPNALINLSRQFTAANGCADMIQFIDKLSTEIELQEKADVLVCDLHGTLPLYGASLPSIIDARKRLLKPGAVMIPRGETIRFALAQADDFYEREVARYLREISGVRFDSARNFVTNRMLNAHGREVGFLSEPELFAALDYASLDAINISAELAFRVSKKGTAHGIRGWFECDLGFGFTTTNSPEADDSVYGAPFFPFEAPVEVEAGDKVNVMLSGRNDKGEYAWDWHTRVFAAGDAANPRFEARQSTLAGVFLSPKELLKKSEFFVPRHNADAKIDLFILNKIDGEIFAGDIADEMLAAFPDNFKTPDEALERFSLVAMRYSE